MSAALVRPTLLRSVDTAKNCLLGQGRLGTSRWRNLSGQPPTLSQECLLASSHQQQHLTGDLPQKWLVRSLLPKRLLKSGLALPHSEICPKESNLPVENLPQYQWHQKHRTTRHQERPVPRLPKELRTWCGQALMEVRTRKPNLPGRHQWS